VEIHAFKTIFRLDYPLSYALVDELGQYTQMVRDHAAKPTFSKSRTNLNLVEHSLVTTGKCKNEDDVFKFTLSLQSLNAVIEHSKGAPLLELHSHPVVKLSDELASQLKFNKFERIGFRTWIIIQDRNYKFDQLKTYFMDNFGRTLSTEIKKNFDVAEDIAVVFESQNSSSKDRTRILMGPYRREEEGRYFSIALGEEIDQGLIIDIDVWQEKYEVPEIHMSRLSKHYFDTMASTVKLIHNKIKSEFEGEIPEHQNSRPTEER
jgi:hypothetical protein